MKTQNAFDYDLVQPAWLRRHPRCLRHAHHQALRTETRVREGYSLLITTVVHNRALNVSVRTSRAYFFLK